MKINRVWAMPDKWTFRMKPIAELLTNYVGDGKGWIDPFAGMNSPAEFTNDLNTEMPTKYHLDAIEFLKAVGDNSSIGVLIDPPYSPRQLSECYKGIGRKVTQWDTLGTWRSWVRDEVARILRTGGVVISFGWNSCGIGKERGFSIVEILLVCHGQTHNDTIVTVERKIQATL